MCGSGLATVKSTTLVSGMSIVVDYMEAVDKYEQIFMYDSIIESWNY